MKTLNAFLTERNETIRVEFGGNQALGDKLGRKYNVKLDVVNNQHADITGTIKKVRIFLLKGMEMTQDEIKNNYPELF